MDELDDLLGDLPPPTPEMQAYLDRLAAERLCAYCEASEDTPCRAGPQYGGVCPYEADLARH